MSKYDPNQFDELQKDETKSKKFPRKLLLLLLILAIAIIAGVLYLRHPRSSPQDTNGHFAEYTQAVNFPIFYPAIYPKGFQLDTTSLRSQSNIFSFTILHSQGNRIIVTEQSRPPIIEEVNKTQQFNTPLGPAYIADLNGHTTGFIQTDQTMMIFSNANKSDIDQLKQIMQSMRQIN